MKKNGGKKMKKVFAILLAFVMVFAFAACGESAVPLMLGTILKS